MQSLAEEEARRFYLTTFLQQYSPRPIRAKILSSRNAPHLALLTRLPYPMRGSTILIVEQADLNILSDDDGNCNIFQHPHLQRIVLGTGNNPSFPLTRELAVSLRFSGDYLAQKWKFFIHLVEQIRRCWLTQYLALGLVTTASLITGLPSSGDRGSAEACSGCGSISRTDQALPGLAHVQLRMLRERHPARLY